MDESTASLIAVTEEQISKLFEKAESAIPEESKMLVLTPEQCVEECDDFICSICLNVVSAHFVECAECSKINCHACIQGWLSKT